MPIDLVVALAFGWIALGVVTVWFAILSLRGADAFGAGGWLFLAIFGLGLTLLSAQEHGAEGPMHRGFLLSAAGWSIASVLAAFRTAIAFFDGRWILEAEHENRRLVLEIEQLHRSKTNSP